LIEIAEAMADTLQHLLARTKGLAAESYLEQVETAAQSAVLWCGRTILTVRKFD
jgi:hypothetical protein